ncbi:MAG TPA: radical SAM family heme chaperone HemW [Myxococcota bacterium]|nr:radical SAM family heme chaperone HemW [Myxococcota bacterium]
MQADVGVYVHVPWCERICPYCDFAVLRARELSPEQERRYADALATELAARRTAFDGRRLASLYLGGGTPSLLRADTLARIVESVRAAFPPAGDVEITLEVNPSTVERARLPDFRAAGVNRISLGAQSFDDATLKRLGRAHRADAIRATLDAIRKERFASLSLDLIFAAPGQSLPLLEADLDALIAAAPDHVSAYELTLEPGTPFGAPSARARLALPDEDAVAEMMLRVESRLADAGYARYEISSYARPGRESVHNRRYWARRPVLGLGMGAVSTDPPDAQHAHGVRRANPRELAPYLADPAACGEVEVLEARVARGEAMFLGLRTARGVDAARFAAEFGAPPRGFFASAIEALGSAGMLAEEESGDLRLTPRGRLLADSIFESFV